MNISSLLNEAVARRHLRDLDLYFARLMAEMGGTAQDEVALAAAIVSARTGEGNVCVELAKLAGQPLFPGTDLALVLPALSDWRAALQQANVVGQPGADTPLILDEADRLYLGRYWHFEATIARRLKALAASAAPPPDAERVRERLNHYFPDGNAQDRQKLAAAVALFKRLTVISGGPGTGKTTTVTRLLALLIEATPLAPRIVLAAPTGKAAARLAESIKQARHGLVCTEAVRQALVTDASTLHRLLGWTPEGFRHHARNPLHLDVLVVDEASMVDVPLMARLLDALPEHARLILLGDRDQLASVEAGSVLGDICNADEPHAFSARFAAQLAPLGLEVGAADDEQQPLADAIVALTHSHRFTEQSGIGQLASAVNQGRASEALAIAEDPEFADVAWLDVAGEALPSHLERLVPTVFGAYFAESDPERALQAFNGFRFLCALRDGPFGVVEVNRQVEGVLRRHGYIRGGDTFYAGRPLLITRNDYNLGLFNGDIGLVLPDPDAAHRLRAFFPTAEGGLRRVLLSRLPAHETVFAMTVHKSQGSEFASCVLLLPDSDAPVLTRELAYTGITRGRSHLELWGSRKVFAEVVARRVERASGLREALWRATGVEADA